PNCSPAAGIRRVRSALSISDGGLAMPGRIASRLLVVWLLVLSPQSGRGDSPAKFVDPLPPGAIARLGTTRLRHADSVSSIQFSPDGKILASAGFDRTVRFWDPATGAPRGQPLRYEDRISSIAFSPDSRTLAAAIDAESGAISLRDIASGKELRRLKVFTD